MFGQIFVQGYFCGRKNRGETQDTEQQQQQQHECCGHGLCQMCNEVHLFCQRLHSTPRAGTHTCKMCTTNPGCTKMCVAWKSMYIVCTLRVESEVHPSPICRRQLARPTLFRIREIGARVKICLFIENPSPVSKAPDQVPREGTPCNDRYKAAEKNLALSLDGVFSIVPWLFIRIP